MASADFKKVTSSAISGYTKHFDNALRFKLNHANKDIDVSRTNTNYFVGCDDYYDMMDKWKKRVIEADALHPPKAVKKDRITAVLVEVPCPWPIVDDGREREFFEAFNEFLYEKFGSENVHGLVIHKDEVHDYLEDGVTKTSMIHAHGIVTPYAKWVDAKGSAREGLNCKNFMTKQMLQFFQKDLNAMCLDRFGYELNTHGLARHKTVEDLKRETLARDMVERQEIFNHNFEKKKEELLKLNNEKEDLKSEIKELKMEHNRLVDVIEKLKRGAYALAQKIIKSRNLEEKGR